MSIKCFDLQDPNPIGVLNLERRLPWRDRILREGCLVICSTLSLRAVNKELTPLIILLTKKTVISSLLLMN